MSDLSVFDPLCLAGVRVLDVSRRLDRCGAYPGDPEYGREVVSAPGEPPLSRLTLCAHSGTHVDAPSHVLPGGPSLDGLERGGLGLGRFVLPALVVAVEVEVAGKGGLVLREELESALKEGMGGVLAGAGSVGRAADGPHGLDAFGEPAAKDTPSAGKLDPARPTSAPLDGTFLTGPVLNGQAVLIKTPNSANPRLARGEFDPGYTALAPDAARLLAELGVALVGVDGPGVDPYEIPPEHVGQRADDGRVDHGEGGHGGAADSRCDLDPAACGQADPGQTAPDQPASDQADPDQAAPGQDNPGLAAHRILLGAGMPLLENLDLSSVEPGLYGLVCLPLALDPGAEASPVRAVLLATK